MFDAQPLRELLSLAKLLRQFADQHGYDTSRELFLSAAVAVEARARFLAPAPTRLSAGALERDMTLHAPVDQFV